jgi:hypothetical protein
VTFPEKKRKKSHAFLNSMGFCIIAMTKLLKELKEEKK